MKKRESQKVRILKWLLKGRKLTQARAYELFECFRLAARILEIDRMGYDIKKKKKRTRSGKDIVEYSL